MEFSNIRVDPILDLCRCEPRLLSMLAREVVTASVAVDVAMLVAVLTVTLGVPAVFESANGPSLGDENAI